MTNNIVMDRISRKIELKTAFEYLNENSWKRKMSTGSADLDSLIDGIQQGMFYLFYGDKRALDSLAMRLIVNCVLPLKDKGFESMALLFANRLYGQDGPPLNPDKIANLAKYCGIEPSIVFKNVFAIVADSQKRQLVCTKQIIEFLDDAPHIKLIVIHRLTCFFDDSSNKKEAASNLKSVIGDLARICADKGIALVATADIQDNNNNNSRAGKVPRPRGGIFLKHLANVIVYFRELSTNGHGNLTSYKVFLIKHGYMKGYKSAVIYPRYQIGKFHGGGSARNGIFVFA